MAKIAKTNALRVLEKHNIEYQLYEYDSKGVAIDGVLVAEKIDKPVASVFKTLVTQGKSKQYFVFVVPVAKELDLKKAAHVVQEKSIQMIPVKDINVITGYVRGGCSPVGMKKQFTTIFDETAKKTDKMIVSAGRIGLQMEVPVALLAELVQAMLADIVKE